MRPSTGSGAILACVLLVISVIAMGFAIVALGVVPALDEWWNTAIATSRSSVLDVMAYFLDAWGAGATGFAVFPALLAVPLTKSRRFSAIPGLFGAGAVSLVVVQTIKPLIDRARPADMTTVSDVGAYPSGHVTNAATLCVFMALVYRTALVWCLASAYVLAMAFSRTYLHAHWLSDTIAGILLGSALAVIAYVLTRRAASLLSRRSLRVVRGIRPADHVDVAERP